MLLIERRGWSFFLQQKKQVKLINPFDFFKLNVNLQFELDVVKYDTPTAVLHLFALETSTPITLKPIGWRFSLTVPLCLNSLMMVLEFISTSFAFYIPVGAIRTAYDSEIIAICVALEQYSRFTRVVILSDSRATLQSLHSIDSTTSSDILKYRNCTKGANLSLSSGFLVTVWSQETNLQRRELLCNKWIIII